MFLDSACVQSRLRHGHLNPEPTSRQPDSDLESRKKYYYVTHSEEKMLVFALINTTVREQNLRPYQNLKDAAIRVVQTQHTAR